MSFIYSGQTADTRWLLKSIIFCQRVACCGRLLRYRYTEQGLKSFKIALLRSEHIIRCFELYSIYRMAQKSKLYTLVDISAK